MIEWKKISEEQPDWDSHNLIVSDGLNIFQENEMQDYIEFWAYVNLPEDSQ